MSNRSKLHSRTLELLRDHPGTILEVAEATGLNYHWLVSFRRTGAGEGGDPGVSRVEKLYVYLSGKELDV